MSNYDGQNPYYGGAGGGGGGGGFVAGGSPFGGSQDSAGGSKKKGGNNTVRPVTCKQIINADQAHPDSDFQVDGHDLGTVLLVGSVRNCSTTATNVNYSVGDGTGYLDVRQWLDSSDNEAGKGEGIGQDQYVAIMGTLKTFGGKRHISATHIRLIQDHNEVYHHLLKALWVSLSLRFPGGGGGGGGIANGAGASKQGMQSDYAAGASNNAGAGAGGGNPEWAGLPTIQRKIMELVSVDTSDEGMHVSSISRTVAAGNNEAAIGEAIEALMGEGLLFSTIDDLHVRAV